MKKVVKWLKVLFYGIMLVLWSLLVVGWMYLVFIYSPKIFVELIDCWQNFSQFVSVGLILMMTMNACFFSFAFFAVWGFFLGSLCCAISDIKKS